MYVRVRPPPSGRRPFAFPPIFSTTRMILTSLSWCWMSTMVARLFRGPGCNPQSCSVPMKQVNSMRILGPCAGSRTDLCSTRTLLNSRAWLRPDRTRTFRPAKERDNECRPPSRFLRYPDPRDATAGRAGCCAPFNPQQTPRSHAGASFVGRVTTDPADRAKSSATPGNSEDHGNVTPDHRRLFGLTHAVVSGRTVKDETAQRTGGS